LQIILDLAQNLLYSLCKPKGKAVSKRNKVGLRGLPKLTKAAAYAGLKIIALRGQGLDKSLKGLSTEVYYGTWFKFVSPLLNGEDTG
jgi:hypothetical protein